MKITVAESDVTQVVTPMLVVNHFQDMKTPSGATAAIDAALGGMIASLVADGEITGRLNEIRVIHTGGRIAARRVTVVGLGKEQDLTLDRVRQVSGTAVRKAASLKVTEMATIAHGAESGGLTPELSGKAIAEGALLGSYDYRRLKTVSDELSTQVATLTVIERDQAKLDALRAGVASGELSAEGTIFARDLSNGPANLITPSYLAQEARDLARQHGLQAEILGPQEMEQRGFRTVLAVAEGSVQEPRLIILRYHGEEGGKTLAVVGKGITFDSGGISIKPSDGMWYMKHDMSGAAAVLGFMRTAAAMKLGVNLLGVIPATENMPGPRAVKPGDVVTSYGGKTIEIQNTDAEGRLVLADALAYAAEQKPDAIVDMATLTGACVVALGKWTSGGFSNDESLLQLMQEAGRQAGERVWPLPVWDEYGEELKSNVADMKNIGAGRYGGAIIGASFLKNFVGAVPWVHIDIAGTAWVEKAQPYIPVGASGVGVRLLLEFVRLWVQAR